MKPRRVVALLAVLFLLGTTGCSPVAPSPPSSEPSATTPSVRIDAAGLHNVYRITPKLISGGVPEGDAGFRSLQTLGVRTIISVDGARPDAARARRFEMRYVHLPFGYDGVPRARALQIARAVRDLPGLVYLHCHHGKHRGPTAAAAAHLCLDERCTVADAVAEMRRAGADPHYLGLYAAPGQIGKPSAAELDGASADFPEEAPVARLAAAMVALDEQWERLKAVKAAGWQTPPKSPDLDPAHEALQLLEQFQEAARLPELADRPPALRTELAATAVQARALEIALRNGPTGADAAAAWEKVNAACVRCHGKYRDGPHGE